jgi:hypothetical protein
MKPLIVFSDVTFDGRSLVGRPQAFGRPKLYFRYLKSYFRSAQFILLEDVAFAARCDHTNTCLLGGWQDYFPPPTQSPAPLLPAGPFHPGLLSFYALWVSENGQSRNLGK